MKKRIIYVLSLIFLLMTVGVEPAGATANAPKVGSDKFTVELGDMGYLRYDSPLKVKVVLSDVAEDFTGSVELRYYSTDSVWSAISEKISLKKGEDKAVFFYPLISSYVSYFNIVVSNEVGEEIYTSEQSFEYGEADEVSSLVIACLVPEEREPVFKKEDDYKVKKVYLKNTELDGDYRGLAVYDLVVVPDDFRTEAGSEVVELIEERKRWGGAVITESEVGEFELNRLFLGKDERLSWAWQTERVLLPVLENLNIKTEKYIFIILIYILIVSPVTYFVLAKLKKKLLYWVFVPVWSFIFTGIVYVAGLESRIENMYMKYVSVLDLREGRKTENTAFSVTNSGNSPYKLEISNGYRVDSLFGISSKNEAKEAEDILRSIDNNANGADIRMAKGTSFSTIFLNAKGSPDINVENTGFLERRDGIIAGEFTNTLPTDLSRVFAVYDDEIIYIGDVARGETKSFSAEAGKVFLADINSRVQGSVYMSRLFDFAYDGENMNIQALMSYLLDKASVTGYKEPFFAAISSERIKGEFAYEAELASGYSLFLMSAENKDGTDDFINSISKLEHDTNRIETGFTGGMLLEKNTLDVTYTIPENMNPDTLSLLFRYKSEVNACAVSVLNAATGNFVPVFAPDDGFLKKIRENSLNGFTEELEEVPDLVFEGPEKFVNNGELTLRYEIDRSVYDELSQYVIPSIPKLSMGYKK